MGTLQRITVWLQKKNELEALVYCTEKIRTKINNKKFVSPAFLDLSKSFDSISHEILYFTLKYLGFNENVPQGTVLGPLLFDLYINNFKQIKTSEYEFLQYADDTVILCCDQSLEKALKRL